MLTVEKIKGIILDYFDSEHDCDRKDFAILAEKTARVIVDQVIYAAQGKATFSDWKPTSEEGEDGPDGSRIVRRETAVQQKRNGQVQREILRNHHGEPISVALCFVPGEGCGDERG